MKLRFNSVFATGLGRKYAMQMLHRLDTSETSLSMKQLFNLEGVSEEFGCDLLCYLINNNELKGKYHSKLDIDHITYGLLKSRTLN